MFSSLELIILSVLGGLFLMAYAWTEIIDPWLHRRALKHEDIDGLFEEHEDVLDALEQLVITQKKTNEHLESLIDVLRKGK